MLVLLEIYELVKRTAHYAVKQYIRILRSGEKFLSQPLVVIRASGPTDDQNIFPVKKVEVMNT